MTSVVLSYDQRPRSFDLDMVETAYLVWLDTPIPENNPAARLHRMRAVMHTLQDEHGWERHVAMTYAQAGEIYAREKGLPL